ncbi:efflux RND transporter periplasmic adaptor subunit [Poritiphilus flavus]|nr:efflux RND transporter periplasmic adaptor subunit [Poritiphilus flavus]
MKLLKYFLLVLILGACSQKKETTPETLSDDINIIEISREQFSKNDMAIGSLQEQEFPEVVNANGLIDVPPENRAVISAVIGGYIERTPLIVGDLVKKGQLLVTLENPEFVQLQQEYLEVSEKLEYLKSEYERQQTLFQENISSEKNYLKTKSDYKMAKARYNGLEKQLRLLNISSSEVLKGNITTTASLYAPISGNVTEVFVSKGTYVSPASPIMEVVDNSHIHLELSVFERDIMNIKEGQPIAFKIPEASERTFMAEVYLVGTTIGQNRTIKVHGHLKNDKDRFLIGMFVEAEIIIHKESSSALPTESVVEIEGKAYTLRLLSQDDTVLRFEKVNISTGMTHQGFTQVKDEKIVEGDDQFLIRGAFGLINVEME